MTLEELRGEMASQMRALSPSVPSDVGSLSVMGEEPLETFGKG